MGQILFMVRYKYTAMVITIWISSVSLCAKKQFEWLQSLKLVETDSANTHQNIESHHRRPLSSLLLFSIHPIQCSVGIQAQTQSATNDCFIDEAGSYSLTQACNNYSPNELKKSWRKKGETWNKPEIGSCWRWRQLYLLSTNKAAD